jgi:uncharacterized protein (DUF2252 family)
MRPRLAQTLELARAQLDLDRRQTLRFPELFARKRAKMAASPHAFLRGSAPLFYRVLAEQPDLATGPAETGWILGDMHLENVGAYRGEDRRAHFDLNDFDEATWAPRHLDVLRLLTSTLLAANASRLTSEVAIRLAESLVDTYASARRPPPPPALLPASIRGLVERADTRSRLALLDARAPVTDGRRRFVRGERYLSLPGELAHLAETLVARYVAALGPRAPAKSDTWRVIDAAHRVAGNGSLGRLRFAILVVDATGDDRILDLKEAGPASPELLVPRDARVPHGEGARMVAGARALVRVPPRLVAAVDLPELGMELFARQLTPAEDKLDVAKLTSPAALEEVVAAAASALGRAHGPWSDAGWSEQTLGALVERAIVLAGLFTELHLATSWVA